MPGDSKKAETYDELKELLKRLDSERGTQGNRAFYLSSSPSLFPAIVENLGEAGLNQGEDGGWSRLVVEKPFGRISGVPRISTPSSSGTSMRPRSTASTTTSARRRSRTSLP